MQHRELIGFLNSHVISAKVWISGFYDLVLFSLVRKELIKKKKKRSLKSRRTSLKHDLAKN